MSAWVTEIKGFIAWTDIGNVIIGTWQRRAAAGTAPGNQRHPINHGDMPSNRRSLGDGRLLLRGSSRRVFFCYSHGGSDGSLARNVFTVDRCTKMAESAL